VLATFPEDLQISAMKQLVDLGVEVRTGIHATNLTENGLQVGDEFIRCRVKVWAAGNTASFVGKTTGKRYGTYDNDNAVGNVTVFDFNLGYTRHFAEANFVKSLTLGVNITNVFDKNYLSSVSINDQGYVKSDPTGSTMLWNIGAPRTVTFTLGLGF